jgi:hypothetical protein
VVLSKKGKLSTSLKISAMILAISPLDWERIAAYAATIEPKNDYPTVIIGAGLGGLISNLHVLF